MVRWPLRKHTAEGTTRSIFFFASKSLKLADFAVSNGCRGDRWCLGPCGAEERGGKNNILFILPAAVNVHPSHFCPRLRSRTLTTTSSRIRSVCAWLVTTYLFSALRTNPARSIALINFAKNCAANRNSIKFGSPILKWIFAPWAVCNLVSAQILHQTNAEKKKAINSGRCLYASRKNWKKRCMYI